MFTQSYLNKKVPYAYAFGNHDSELDMGQKQMAELDASHPYSMFEVHEGIDPEGYSNYYIKVMSSFEGKQDQASAIIWIFDTHSKNCEGKETGYGCINSSQLKWYSQESEKLKSIGGANIQGLAFFHIPLQQFMDVWNEEQVTGRKRETVGCCSYETGAFK